MRNFKIVNYLPPTRCEICHQHDCFNPLTNSCSRCAGILLSNIVKESAWRRIGFLNSPFNISVNKVLISAIAGLVGSVIILLLIPNIFGTRCYRSGASAVETMRLYHSTQATYQAGVGDGNFASAAELFYEDFIDPAIAEASFVPEMISRGGQLCSGKLKAKNGYLFFVRTKKQATWTAAGFTVIGISTDPFIYKRNFYVDEEGIIRYAEAPTIPDANSPPISN